MCCLFLVVHCIHAIVHVWAAVLLLSPLPAVAAATAIAAAVIVVVLHASRCCGWCRRYKKGAEVVLQRAKKQVVTTGSIHRTWWSQKVDNTVGNYGNSVHTVSLTWHVPLFRIRLNGQKKMLRFGRDA